ncbi:MAG: PhzF family phenazine biosynthesis protein [Burkholderiaceae bacterium]
MTEFPFHQVDVFASSVYSGNPLAVVHGADALSDEQMQAFARWTNLSETTFLLRPTESGADYRVRIFTPAYEMPFAGHPTLGSCHAWLQIGGQPAAQGRVVQECGIGLVTIRRDGERLAFAAPPLQRSGPLPTQSVLQIAAALGIDKGDIVDHQWADNGPNWQVVRLATAAQVRALQPNMSALGDIKLGVVGAGETDDECQFEVRAFAPKAGVPEDPVTGSLNAGIAQWLIGAGIAPDRYVAAQGTAIGRRGRVYVERDGDGTIWVGGLSVTRVEGTASF